MRLAVLSDLHIDAAASPASLDAAEAAFRRAIEVRADHVVVAGDLFDSAGAMLRDRPAVERLLRRLGLWTRDRLTVVPGNHDVFHTPHRGTLPRKAIEFPRALVPSVRERAEALGTWLAPLALEGDQLDPRRPFPLLKNIGGVTLVGADTTARKLVFAANGFWRHRADRLLREALSGNSGPLVIVAHHPAKRSRLCRIADLLTRRFPLGFPPRSFTRLEAFLVASRASAYVCGHVHASRRYQWTVGEESPVPVYMMGRTGGLHGRRPAVGLLDVPARGAVRWSEVAVASA
jgi:Icc-related predicted phosphoesterase